MSVKATRAYRLLAAALILCLLASGVPVRSTAAEPTAPIGRIENGVWRLDPANYTYRALQNVKELNLSGKGVTVLEGIEHLGALTSLDISHNRMENLDLSKCRKLTELNCSDNLLTSLDITPCTRLKVLDCSGNSLGELSVAAAKNIQTLDCRNCGLKELNIEINKALTELYCSGNELPGIDVGHLKRLQVLDVAGVGISSLNVTKNESLASLDCSANPELKELNLKTNRRLRELYTVGTAITSLDLGTQSGFGEMFTSRNGYQYDLSETARTWKSGDTVLSVNPATEVRIKDGIALKPAVDDLRSRIALAGYRQYKPGEFTKLMLSSSFEELSHYFSITVGPARSIFRKVDEDWFYENAHTVVEKAGLAVGARRKETDKVKSATRTYTVFDENGNFKLRCSVDYMENEKAVEFARRLNKDHETQDEDLRGYSGQVKYFVCGNGLITLEGIPSAAQERTPTLESYIMSDPNTLLYLIN